MKLTALLVPMLVACAALAPGALAAQKAQVRHVVVFKFKAAATPAQIKQVTDALVALKGKIPGIVAVEHGVNNSPEKKNLGFTHVFLITFEDAAARDAYLPHPEHQKFGALLGSLSVMEDVFVVDYEPSR